MTLTNNKSPLIGTLLERSMHLSLKQRMAFHGDLIEQVVDEYVIDIVRGDLLIEIQTKSFSKIKNKLTHLLDQHRVLLLHPIPIKKFIVKSDENGEFINRRKSPKTGRIEDFFREAVYIPDLLINPNLSVKILMVNIDEYWVNDKKGSWRRQYWSIVDKKVTGVIKEMDFYGYEDYLHLLPQNIKQPFTNKDLASKLGISNSLAGKMSYTLRKMGILNLVGKSANSFLFMKNI